MGNFNKNSRIKQRLYDLKLRDKFQEKVKEIRKRFNIPDSGYKTRAEVDCRIFESFNGNHICSINDNKASKKDYWIEDVLKEFKIPSFYEKFIEDYIYYNDFFKNSVSNEISAKGCKARVFFAKPNNFYINDDDNVGNINLIYIEVNAETSKKDIDAIWPEIKEMQKTLVGYKKKHKLSSLRNMEINEKIYKMKKKGATGGEAAKVIREEYGMKNFMYDSANKRMSRFKAKKRKL